MHKLTLTNNAANLVGQILAAPGTFGTPVEILRAGKLMEKLEVTPPADPAALADWLVAPFGEIEISEAQRELLKQAVTKVADKLPAGRVTTSLLEQLGFVEA